MVTLGKRRTGVPFLQALDGSIIRPKRVSFTQKTFDEYRIQELIHANPEILPIDEIESVFSPPISIGRETPTRAGFIDNLYLSPQGYLTLVETKLWRNPEARREVVGQIIDYAKEISKWSFKELEDQVRVYNQQYRGKSLGIVETLEQEQGEEIDEPFLTDSISRNLQQGRFLLLIVGDGIRESVEDMVEFLAQTPQLQFTLALIELQIYELDHHQNQSLLIIPQLVTRTREITRAIVKVEAKHIESISIGLVEPSTTNPLEEIFFQTLSKKVTDSEITFVRSVIEDMENLDCKIEWESTIKIKLPNPSGSGENFSLFYIYKDGLVNLRYLRDQLAKAGLPKQIGLDFVKHTASLFENCNVHSKDPMTLSRYIKISEFQQQYINFKLLVQETIERINASNSR